MHLAAPFEQAIIEKYSSSSTVVEKLLTNDLFLPNSEKINIYYKRARK